MLETIPVHNPRALKVPEFVDLFKASVDKSPWKGKDLLGELEKMVLRADVGVFVTVEDGKFVALSITFLPVHVLDTTPQVAHLYNEGSPSARRSLVDTTVDFIKRSGYNSFWAVNYTGNTDKAWAKVMKAEGWDINPIGSIMEFSCK
jgi:hypothetical protein